jgi:endonuclease/exonuclease/phosphatase family metal-dependent hydrolase
VRILSLAGLLALGGGASACTGGHHLVSHPGMSLASGATAVSWVAPEIAADLASLGRWRRSVGPPVTVTSTAVNAPADTLIVVNWNMHVGGGDIATLLSDVRRQAGTETPVVFLLQEAYRSGPEVPNALDRHASWASGIRGLRADGTREEIESIAKALELHAYYVPSMRNGDPLTSDEDRGNAILSTLPLTELTAIELPFERQRRVAVAATVSGVTERGESWRLRVVSAHLDNMVGARRLWVAGGEFGRTRQARGLMEALAGESPLVLGADLNSWFGFRDSAYLEAARAFPQTVVTDRRSTFRGLLRLDHLFFRLDEPWSATFRRADQSYGSDHHPLIGRIDFSADL